MSAPRRCLVVGYDGSESSRRAVTWAARTLGKRGRLVLVHAERSLHAPALADAATRAEIGHAVLDEALLDAGEELLDVAFASELSGSDPARALVESATRHRAEAIVVGAKRHSRLRRALGVVTDELLARSPVPVFVVPAGVSVAPAASARPRPARSREDRSETRAARAARRVRRA